MFDHFVIDKKFLPKHISEETIEWQTKSLEKSLSTIEIDGSGQVWETEGSFFEETSSIKKRIFYTGEIRYYTSINDIWFEFVAFIENGVLLKNIQVQPKE